MKINKSELKFLGYQALICLMFVGIWAIQVFQFEKRNTAIHSVMSVATIMAVLWIIFAVNNYLLIPKLYESKKHPRLCKWVFWLINPIVIFFVNGLVFRGPNGNAHIDFNETVRQGMYIFGVSWIIVNYGMIGLAFGRRSFVKQQQVKAQLAEMKKRNTEAELAWLKNQLNPHFLFNTLNNISSLTQIDADKAQDSIGQLSDLLRYALYDTKSETVDINGEIEFMRNYIELMSLRCDENVDIQTHFNIQDSSRKIAPMLLLSPIENAFKHGVSSNKPSFIHISLTDSDGSLIFTCENSNYPKNENNHSGSGIGVENLKRRLELIYPGKYEFEQKLENETYKIKIILK